MFVHQLQQQRPHDVGVVLQLSMQRHRQERGKITPGAIIEVGATLQSVDELQVDTDMVSLVEEIKLFEIKSPRCPTLMRKVLLLSKLEN